MPKLAGPDGTPMRTDTRTQLVDVLRWCATIDNGAALLTAITTLQPPHVAFSDRCQIVADAVIVDGTRLPIATAAGSYASQSPKTLTQLFGNRPGMGHELRHRIAEQVKDQWGLTLEDLYSITLDAITQATPTNLWPAIHAYTTGNNINGTPPPTTTNIIDQLTTDAGYTLTQPTITAIAA